MQAIKCADIHYFHLFVISILTEQSFVIVNIL